MKSEAIMHWVAPDNFRKRGQSRGRGYPQDDAMSNSFPDSKSPTQSRKKW